MTFLQGSKHPARSGLVYMGQFLVSTLAIIAFQETGAINRDTGFLLFLCAMALMIPAARAFIRSAPAAGAHAIARYSKGMIVASFAYALGLGAAISLDARMEIDGAIAFGVAMLPVLPIFYMIFVIGRYLTEEPDEYLRHRATIASLAGLGLLLGFSSFWGFLERFDLAPHLPGWMAVPVWALGMGLAQGWLAWRDRAPAEDEL